MTGTTHTSGIRCLGLYVSGAQSSAALLEGNTLVAAIAEERLNREKRSRNFPQRAIAYCLEQAGIPHLDDLDYVVIPWNPMSHMKRLNMSGFTSRRRYDPEWLYIVPNNLTPFMRDPDETGMEMQLSLNGSTRLLYLNHHLAHMGWAYASPFEEAAVAVFDEYGEFYSCTMGKLLGNDLSILRQISFPHSLGVFYATFTEFLGFVPNSDEWKVMGAAAYGDPARFAERLRGLARCNDGQLELDQNYFEFANMKFGGYFSEKLERYLGMAAKRDNGPLSQEQYDLAAATELVFEELVINMLTWLHRQVKSSNLVVSGGCFMNSLTNGKIIDKTPFDNIYISFAPADNGSAIGGTLWVAAHRGKSQGLYRASLSAYTGQGFTDEEIRTALESYKVAYSRPKDIAVAAVDYLSQGKIIGWFQGQMEFGERALGNRSILADPRDAAMKDKINRAVKYREAFRPFAPSILDEYRLDYFEMPPQTRVDYMEQVYKIRPEKQREIPAVVHNDGTGRLQTVRREHNERYHRLISEFHHRTGVPVLLNTSFNINNEPIVCTVADALRTFIASGLDALCIGDYLVRK